MSKLVYMIIGIVLGIAAWAPANVYSMESGRIPCQFLQTGRVAPEPTLEIGTPFRFAARHLQPVPCGGGKVYADYAAYRARPVGLIADVLVWAVSIAMLCFVSLRFRQWLRRRFSAEASPPDQERYDEQTAHAVADD